MPALNTQQLNRMNMGTGWRALCASEHANMLNMQQLNCMSNMTPDVSLVCLGLTPTCSKTVAETYL
jgi:hypothetical protein